MIADDVQQIETVAKTVSETEPTDIIQNYEDKEFLAQAKTAAEVYRQVDDVILDMREAKNEKVSDIDHNAVIATTTDLLSSSKSTVRKMYERYQEKWLQHMKDVNLELKDVKNKI